MKEIKAHLLPKGFEFLEHEAGPLELVEALRHLGVLERVGKGSNPDITGWANEVGVKGWYPDDDVPWCGLFKGVCAKRAGWLPKPKYDLLSALSWLEWGVTIDIEDAMLGDTLVFSRKGGGHVGYYVGEDELFFYVLGGNQSNSVNITKIAKSRCVGVRRAKWRISQPENVRKIIIGKNALYTSKNEA
jgi:uncharacterized protein (TIGR02594 family)